MAFAQTVSNAVSRLEKDLGVDGAELTVLFCLMVVAVIVLLFSQSTSTRNARDFAWHTQDGSLVPIRTHAASTCIVPHEENQPDPMTMGPRA